MGQESETAAILKRLTLKALQEKCKAQNLNSVGTKAKLIERLCEEIQTKKEKKEPDSEKKDVTTNGKEKVEEKEEEKVEEKEAEEKEEKTEEEEEPDVEMVESDVENVEINEKNTKNNEKEENEDEKMGEKDEEKGSEEEADVDDKIVVDLEPSDDEAMATEADAAAEYTDCADDPRPRVTERWSLHVADSTLDSFLGPARTSMTSLCCEGFQYLFCRSRTNYGLCGGIYCYEVRWLEKSRSSGTVRFGFSKKKYSGFLNDADSIGFTSEGGILGAGEGLTGARFDKGDTLAVIADFKKPQTASISLFLNGARVCPKIPLPEPLKQCLASKEGLFPTFCSKNAALSMNLSKQMWSNLDFKVCMIGNAAEDDTVPNPIDVSENPEVIFPMVLPEHEMSFQVPEGYLNVSDPFLLDWIEKSENKASPKGFNVKTLDEREPLLSMLRHLCICRRQNVVVFSDNLFEFSRKELLKTFVGFRTKAVVDLSAPCDSTPLESAAKNGGDNFTKFTLPSKSEGFDEIVFNGTETEDRESLAKYIELRKLTERLTPIPSQEFRRKWDTFTKDFQIWGKQHRALDMAGLEENEYTEDVMVVNIFNGGVKGKPIFAFFSEEDWLILSIRFQYALMVHWFCQQYGRTGFHIKHFEYYYFKYYGKATKPQDFDKESVKDVIHAYVPELEVNNDMVSLKEGVDLEPLSIMRLVEAKRRERAFRFEAGDEMARLCFEICKENRRINGVEDSDKRQAGSRSRGADRRRSSHSRSHSRRSRSARRRRDDRRESDRRNQLGGVRR